VGFSIVGGAITTFVVAYSSAVCSSSFTILPGSSALVIAFLAGLKVTLGLKGLRQMNEEMVPKEEGAKQEIGT